MAINLELPSKLQAVIEKAHQGAAEMLRPISRKYDLKEHAYPVELDTLATLFEGISEAKTISFAGAEAFRDAEAAKDENHNGGNMSAVLNAIGDQLGRRRADAVGAAPGPGQRGDLAASPPTSSWSGSARMSGPQWPSPSRASARTPLRCRRPRCSTATST